MHCRFIIALSVATVMASALPALAGPNNGGTFPQLPLFKREAHRSHATPKSTPNALLGDTSEETGTVRALRPGVTGKQPTRQWQRRPSEGK